MVIISACIKSNIATVNKETQTMRKAFIAILTVLFLTSCEELHQIAQQYPDVANQTTAPTNSEIIAGLKDALRVGITNAVKETNKKDGFYGNSLIHIPVPEEAQKVVDVMNKIGMSKVVDDFELSLNRAAEEASGQAVNIFTDAIMQMTISDAYSIWKGEDDAATQYLMRTTQTSLENAFSPITKQAIEQVHVTKYWDDVANVYNSVPFVKPVNPDLEKYVNEKAISGLFVLVAQEEKKIREDPAARVTDILKRVFGYNG